MYPTLPSPCYSISIRAAYWFNDPVRGDIVLFRRDNGDKTIFASEKFIRANIYKMFIKYRIINEEDEDIKLLILHEYINKKDNKKIKNKLTLGSVIVSPYANSLIKKQYTKLFNLIFDPNELNMRNNIAHINNESSDYLCLGDTAVLMQLLWDIITEDIFE